MPRAAVGKLRHGGRARLREGGGFERRRERGRRARRDLREEEEEKEKGEEGKQEKEDEDEEHDAPQHFAENNKEAQTAVTPGGERRPAGEEGEGRGRGEAAAAPGSPGALLPLAVAAATAALVAPGQPALKRDAFSLNVLACALWSTLGVTGCQVTPNGASAGTHRQQGGKAWGRRLVCLSEKIWIIRDFCSPVCWWLL